MSDMVERKFGELMVRIDRDTCIANESCTAVAPEIFRLDDDRICSFVEPAAAAVDRDRLLEACRVCPVDALIVVDDQGDEIVP